MAQTNEVRLKTVCKGEVMITYTSSSVKLEEFYTLLREIFSFSRNQLFTVKWIDEENDPCTISSQEELDEAFHLYRVNKNSELVIHIFPSVPPAPGKLCEGENKAVYSASIRPKRKSYKVNEHVFQAKRLNKRAYCAFCSERIWILGQKGFKCINCKLLIHKKCHKLREVDCIAVLESPSLEDEVARMSFLGKEEGNENNPLCEDQEDKIERGIDVGDQEAYNINSFNLLRVIGRGSYAKVLMVELRSTRHIYAMKVIKKELICEDDERDWLHTEKSIYEKISYYPFLVGLHSCFQTKSRLFFVIEFMPGGDLMYHMQRRKRLNEDHSAFYTAEIALALNFLHEKKIIYRDMKLDNILIDHEGHIKLTDYGLCKQNIGLGDTTSTFCGTPKYIAPEILRGDDYSFGVDWWGLGVLLFEMLAGRSPFVIVGTVENPDEYTEDHLFQVILENTIRMPRHFSVRAKNICKGFLSKNPIERLGCYPESSFADIKSHKFYSGINWERLERRQVSPPYRPLLKTDRDLAYFDREFTNEPVVLTPGDQNEIDKIDQRQFDGFEYINPLLMSTEDCV